MSDQAAPEPADDGDDVALDGGAAATSDDDTGAVGDVVLRGQARLGRVISEKTRALFKSASAKVKEQLADGDDDMVPAIVAEGSAAAPATTAEGGAQPPAPPQAGTVATPPVPQVSLVPEVVKQHEAANLRQQQLDQREQALAAREKEVDHLATGDGYLDDRVGAVKALLKRWGVASTDEDARAELMDLVTEISYKALGVPPDPNVAARMDARRATKKVDLYGAKSTKREAELAQKAEQVRYQEWRGNTVPLLTQEITKPEHAQKFPFLAVEDNPGELVLDVIEEQHKRDGTELHYLEAAKRVNDYLTTKWRAAHAKRANLLTAAPSAGAAPAGSPAPTQGDQSSIRRSRTLSNAAAAAPQGAQPLPPKPGEAGFTMKAHREATKAKFKAAMRKSAEE